MMIKKKLIDNLTITSELSGILKQVNLNSSWKNKSSKMNKTKNATTKNQTKYNNLMTEEDLDRLFEKSKQKQKQKLKTQVIINAPRNCWQQKRRKDFLQALKFLKIEDQFDKLLTGLPYHRNMDKENQFSHTMKHEQDLTSKFKKDYLVGKVIGEGAYASVRVALYKPENKKIAIKTYEKGKIKETPRKKSVRRQIRILQLLDHINIVKIYDVVETNNHVNIVMEYLPGISLNTSLKNQPNQKFTQSSCKTIIKSLAKALKYIHDKNISHRDIKLENVILDDFLSPKLIDFGFSTCIQKQKKIKLFCGTPSYMSPQIIQKKQYRGEAADIWALGVLFFVLMTGHFPYKGSSDQELYRKINNAEYSRIQVSTCRDASNLLAKMFTINPDQRISAGEILNHQWFTDKKDYTKKPKKVQEVDLKKILKSSKEKQQSFKKKKRTETSNEKYLLKTLKDISLKLNNTYGRNKLERTLKNFSKQKEDIKSYSNKKVKKQRQIKNFDVLKLQIKKRKEEHSKCKSHR